MWVGSTRHLRHHRSDGLAVGPDGTLYFTSDHGTHAWVGRLPPVGPLDIQWLRIDNSPITTGLAFDGTRSRLYVASVSGRRSSGSISAAQARRAACTSGNLI